MSLGSFGTGVTHNAAAHQRLIEREEMITAIREGLADVEADRTRPAREALKSLAQKYGLTVPGE